MFHAHRQSIDGYSGETIALSEDARNLTFADVILGWREDVAFRDFFIATLTETAYPGFFWEMPPLERAVLHTAFECAVIRGDSFARMRADDADFAGHLNASAAPVTAFRNLGGDAFLIAPRKISDADCYGHLASFLRAGPRPQQHALFQSLAHHAVEMLDTGHRFWISTSGLGVPWVHLRLDSIPKYYQYRRYAEA